MTTTAPPLGALAIHGGEPVRRLPFPTWPQFDEHDAAMAGEVLLSGRVNYWTGPHGRAFEREFGEAVAAPHAVALANGTVAIEIALRTLGVRAGDEVVVPSATFIATASAVVACGARPVVVDVDIDSQALTTETVAPAITDRTAAVIVVHVGGYPANVSALAALTQAHGLHLIEDCAQALGASRDGCQVGRTGVAAAWSFCQDKIMTTAGEGGALTTADPELARRFWEAKDHGKSHEAVYDRAHAPGFRWLHDTFGGNARMTEVQAAVGRLQLPKLDSWAALRREYAEILRGGLGDLEGLRLPRIAPGVEHAYYRFYGHVLTEQLRPGWNRDRIVAAIEAEGVPCAFGGCTEIYRERAFDSVGRPDCRLPGAEWLGRRSIVLPVHPALTRADVEETVEAVRKVFATATS